MFRFLLTGHQFTHQIEEIRVPAFPHQLNGHILQNYQGVIFHTRNLSFIPLVVYE